MPIVRQNREDLPISFWNYTPTSNIVGKRIPQYGILLIKKKQHFFSLGSMKGLTNVSIRTGKKCLSHFYSNKRHHQILTIEWNNQQIISEPDHLCIYKALLLNLSSKTKLSHPFRTFYIPLQSMTSSLHLHFALTIKCHHKKLYYQYFIFMTHNLFNR